MGWMPRVDSTLVAFKRLEEGKEDLVNSSYLFWLFCNGSMTTEEFRNRLAEDNARLQKDKPKGGGYLDPEIESLVVQGAEEPEMVGQLLADRLDILSRNKHVPYVPGQIDDPTALFVFTHIESARLVSTIGFEGYSEKCRTILSDALNSFSRCEFLLQTTNKERWPKYLSASLYAVGSFLFVTQFSIQRFDSHYEEALQSFLTGIDLLMKSKELYKGIFWEEHRSSRRTWNAVEEIPAIEYSIQDIKRFLSDMIQPPPAYSYLESVTPKSAPWVQILTPQASADCFEPLKNGGRVQNPKVLASACRRLIEVCRDNALMVWGGNNYIKDSNNMEWEPVIYWYNALGWVEAQLSPSDLRDLYQQTEDSAAEHRLRTYFFSNELWESLSRRAQSSLVNADRDLFIGTSARNEALLNELRIALEELLLHGLWNPLNEWILRKDERRSQGKDFTDLERGLGEKHHSPGLLEFEKMCRMEITSLYLDGLCISEEERGWILRELPNVLAGLRKARRRSEHESSHWTHTQLATMFSRLLGIGQPGVLPRLATILLTAKAMRKK